LLFPSSLTPRKMARPFIMWPSIAFSSTLPIRVVWNSGQSYNTWCSMMLYSKYRYLINIYWSV
jgi:hypothetical protein